MSLTRKVAYNTIVQVVGKVVTTALSLVLVGYLTRYLGVAGYGQYTTIFAYVSFWAVLADFGFFWVLVRELAKPGADKQYIFNNVFTLKIIFTLVVFCLSAIIGFFVPQYPWIIKIGILIVSISWIWMSLNSTYVGLFQSQLEMYKSVISEVVSRIILLAILLIFIKLNVGLDKILLAYILGNFANFFVSYLLGRKHIKYGLGLDFKFWKIILIESLPLALLSFIGIIHFKMDTVILSIMKGSLDVGIYGVPYKILEIIILLPGIFIGNVFPILTKYYHEHDNRLNDSIQKSFDFLIMLALPIVAGLIILAWPIINLVAGTSYLYTSTITLFGLDFPAPRLLIILAFSIGISFILNIFSNLLTVIGKQFKQLVPMAIITLINLTLNIIFIRYYSYVAAALVNCFTGLLMLIWWSKLSHKYLNFKLNYSIAAKAFLATIIMSIGLYFLRNINILFSVIAGIIIYFLIGYILKIFDKEIMIRIMPAFLLNKNKGKYENRN